MDDLIQQGKDALQAGNRDEARKLFLAAVKQNRDSERTWMLLYNVADNDQERTHCLKQILRINPKNERANRFLTQLKNDPTQTKENIIESPKIGDRLKNILFVVVIVVCCVMFILNVFNKSPNPGNGTATPIPIVYNTKAPAYMVTYNLWCDNCLFMGQSGDYRVENNELLTIKKMTNLPWEFSFEGIKGQTALVEGGVPGPTERGMIYCSISINGKVVTSDVSSRFVSCVAKIQ